MMQEFGTRALMHLEPDTLRPAYDRTPLGFEHELHTQPHFKRDSLDRLAAAYTGHPFHYFVAGSAPTPGTVFYDVPTKPATPAEALSRLDAEPTRVLMKRPELFDPAYRTLLDALFDEVARAHGSLRREDVIRLEGAVLITSAASTTPFHFDPEIGFFSQIEGEKTYHVYAPDCLSDLELEAFYRRARIDIAQIDLSAHADAKDYAFQLAPGRGLHQPMNAPHWVETHASRSVSYTFIFETRMARIRNRARGFNHYLRRLGLTPAEVGSNAALDVVKATALQAAAKAKQTLHV